MPYRLKLLFAFCLMILSTNLWSQSGNYFLSHYAPSEERFDYVCFDMAQDVNGVMYFATKAGILEFDGRDWDLLQVQSAVYSIKINDQGQIFWAGAKGYGRITADQHGFQQAVVLSDSSTRDVFQSIVLKDKVYFLSDESIYIFDNNTSKTTTIKLDADNAFLRIFELFDVVYANTEKGTFKLENGKLVAASLSLSAGVLFYSRIDDNYIVGTVDNKIFTCSSNLDFKQVILQDQSYIDASVVISGNWLNRQLLALGTLRGGVIFLNPINGKTQEIINYATGLPDNEVFTMMIDETKNVWVAHEYGFTMIAPFMPINSFSHYQGLHGNLLCAYSSQNSVYVGTSLGVFKLEKVDLYDELVYYVDVEISDKKPTTPQSSKQKPVAGKPQEVPKEEVTDDEKAKSQSKKGGLFSFLRRKDRNKDSNDKAGESQIQESTAKKSGDSKNKTSPTPSKTTPKFRREKRTEKILRSSQFVFKKVEGIDSKINHLVEINGRLIASGLSGIYEIAALKAKPILEEPTRIVHPLPGKNILLASTYNNGLKSYEITATGVKEKNFITGIDDQIHYIFEGKGNELWLCGLENIYRAEIGDSVNQIHSIESLEKNSDKTIGIVWEGEVLLVNPEGFYSFNRSTNDVLRIDSLPAPSQHFAHGGNILYRDVHGWYVLGDSDDKRNLQLLNIFENLRFIAEDKDPANLWLISGKNELYKFYSERVTPYETGFPLYLKDVINMDRKIANRQEIEMDQEHSSVKFHVVQPDFINPQAVEFRYFLEGMQTEWTEWSTKHNVIDFPYLPNGEYTLQVQAKNIFGKITELEPVNFEVLPPYWKRSWFYAMEFAIIAMLVILSFRLSTRYRIVSRLLSLLTIILLMQFVQTAIEASLISEGSPVIEFLAQVIVALVVLPVEGYLRSLMLRSIDSSGKFYQFMVQKGAPPKIITKQQTPVEETTEANDKAV